MIYSSNIVFASLWLHSWSELLWNCDNLNISLAVATRRISAAPQSMYIAQPSLSIQIGGLEELGTRLFDRLGRKVVLTQAVNSFQVHMPSGLCGRWSKRNRSCTNCSGRNRRSPDRRHAIDGQFLSAVRAPLVSKIQLRFPSIHLQVRRRLPRSSTGCWQSA